jgi:hypothetical protein
MSFKELKKLHRKFTKKYWKLFDESSPFEERKLSRLVADKKNTAMRQSEIESVCDFILENVYRSLRLFVNDYTANINNNMLNIFGKVLTITQFCDTANILFMLLDTDYFIWCEESSHGVNFIFGIFEECEIVKIKYYIIREEFICSPECIFTPVEIYKDTVIIRRVVIEIRFFDQFQKFFNKDAIQRVLVSQNTYLSIKEGLKKYVLRYTDASNTIEVILKKNALMEDMLDGAIWLGFGRIISHNDMETEHYHFKSVFLETDNNIGYAMLEGMAAWAPEKETKKGSFARFLETAATDIKRATRNIYLYLLDNFYYEDFENLTILSKVLIGTAFQFILSDGEGNVDFAAISAKKEDIYSFFKNQYAELVNQLISVIKKAEFDFLIEKLDPHAWNISVKFLKEYAMDSYILFENILTEKSASVELELLRMATNGNESKYHYSLQEYIIERAKEINILEKSSKWQENRNLKP